MNQSIKNIISDGIILLMASAALAIVTKSFFSLFNKEQIDSNAISTLIIKESEKNEPVGKAMARIKSHLSGAFVFTRENISTVSDLHQRSVLMMLCNANNNTAETTLKQDKKRLPYISYLVKNGVDIHTQDANGWTALFWASWSGLPDTAELLIRQGSKINIADSRGNTPLMMAALKGNKEVVAKLLENGANKNITCKNGMTALDYAKREHARISPPGISQFIPATSDDTEDRADTSIWDKILSSVQAGKKQKDNNTLRLKETIDLLEA